MNLQKYLDETGIPDVSEYKDAAKRLITSQMKASVAMLQSRMHLSYVAAEVLLNELEKEGFTKHTVNEKSGQIQWILAEEENQ